MKLCHTTWNRLAELIKLGLHCDWEGKISSWFDCVSRISLLENLSTHKQGENDPRVYSTFLTNPDLKDYPTVWTYRLWRRDERLYGIQVAKTARRWLSISERPKACSSAFSKVTSRGAVSTGSVEQRTTTPESVTRPQNTWFTRRTCAISNNTYTYHLSVTAAQVVIVYLSLLVYDFYAYACCFRCDGTTCPGSRGRLKSR